VREGGKKRQNLPTPPREGNFTREARITWSRSREKNPGGNVREEKKGRGKKERNGRATLAYIRRE